MKASTSKTVTATAITIALFTGFLTWYPFVFALAWPGLALARLGLPYSWIFTVAVILGGLVCLILLTRSLSWLHVISVSAVLPAVYCAFSFLFATRLPIPLPATTPYEAFPLQKAAYLNAYENGYRDGTLGIMRTYCFYPEFETKGFYDGAYKGNLVWWRFLGSAMPERVKQILEVSAGRDGVRMNEMNRNQPP